VHNDFERSVFVKYPQLETIKNKMRDMGCHAAVMSGSGSTLIGITTSADSAYTIAAQLERETTVQCAFYATTRSNDA
jgi:4-diphosphocytidyl-2-C-methyl-D-erythritol kinase